MDEAQCEFLKKQRQELLAVIKKDPVQFVMQIQNRLIRVDLELGEFFLALQRVSRRSPNPVEVAAFIMCIRGLARKELGLGYTTPTVQAVGVVEGDDIAADFWGMSNTVTEDLHHRFKTPEKALEHWGANHKINTPQKLRIYGWLLVEGIPKCVATAEVIVATGAPPEYLTEGVENES